MQYQCMIQPNPTNGWTQPMTISVLHGYVLFLVPLPSLKAFAVAVYDRFTLLCMVDMIKMLPVKIFLPRGALRASAEYVLVIVILSVCLSVCHTGDLCQNGWTYHPTFRPRRSRSAAAYSHQTLPWTVCPYVRASVGLSSALWKNGGLDPDAVWHHRWDAVSRDEAGGGVWGSVHGKGYFWGRIWGAPL